MSRLEAEMHPFLTKDAVEALFSKQVYTVSDFVRAEAQQIVKVARLNFREVLAVRNYLLKKFAAQTRNGFDCYRETINNTAIIPTGMKGVDDLLNGGLFTGNIYEICGLPATGKTQFVLTIMRNIVHNTQQQVYLFDTKNDFSGLRMKSTLNGLDKKQQTDCLSRILINRTLNKHDLISGLYDVKSDLENGLKLRLIVIDSLPCVILNSHDHTSNNASLNHLANIMRYIATEHHVVFLVVNLITTWNDMDAPQETLENVACGKYWSTVPNTRIKIEKLEDSELSRVTIQNSDTFVSKINNGADIRFTDEGFS